jgi:predicted Zn-ribbon and HTH transcriptional regulator
MTRVQIPHEHFGFKDKLDYWAYQAYRRGQEFLVTMPESQRNWKVRRLFYCENCQQRATQTGRKKARCPKCRKPMIEYANYVVPYERPKRRYAQYNIL